MQEEAEAVTAQLESATAQYQAARVERGDVIGQWEHDKQDLEGQIRWGCPGVMEYTSSLGVVASTQDWLLHDSPRCLLGPCLAMLPAGLCTPTWL